MRKRVHMYSELDEIRCDVAEAESAYAPTIWIRGDNSAVSLTFDRADRAKLRAALDQADAIADKT